MDKTQKKSSTVFRQTITAGTLPAIVLEMQDRQQFDALVQKWETEDKRFGVSLQAGVAQAKALDELGVRLCLNNQVAEAIPVLGAAVSLDPNRTGSINNLAVALQRAGRTDQAIGCVERSLGINRKQADSWIFLGTMRQSQDDLIGAKAAYETAIKVQPFSPLAWQGLGLVKQKQRDYPAAIECIRNCIRQDHATAPVIAVLGQLFYAIGDFEKSRDAYVAALDQDSENPVYRQVLSEIQLLCNLIENKIDSLDDFVAQNRTSNLNEVLHKTFALLSVYGNIDTARIVAEKRASLFPDSATAAYLVRAIRGDPSITRSPDYYLIESFDEMADRFDQHLLTHLGYDIPEQLVEQLSQLLPSDKKLDVLDAGCGTGLCGPLVRDFAASLIGVDLSTKMLNRASDRHVYDALECAEITSYLANHRSGFDLIIATDVIIYFGDLAALHAALIDALRPGGLLAFSIETLAETFPKTLAVPDYQLLSSGRFAHRPEYIRSIFGIGLVELAYKETTVRLEAARQVAGSIFVFHRA